LSTSPNHRRDRDSSRGAPSRDRSQHHRADRVRLWGRHAVAAALANPERPCLRLLGSTGAIEALGALAERSGLERRVAEGHELDRLVPSDSPHQGLVLEVGPLPDRALAEIAPDPGEPALVVALDQVSDPRNLGAILRTAAALGVAGVVLPRRRSAELGGACAKAASGALDIVPIVEVVNLSRALAELKERGFWVVGLDAAGPDRVDDLPPEPRRALVLGAEGSGLRRLVAEGCDRLARIEIGPQVESLNVAVAAGIALYLLRPVSPPRPSAP
jgi:23S rRNA (guanosine2251-2'-O)-methyltransferase